MSATIIDIQSVLAQTDLVSLIQDDIELKRTGHDYQARCPFHDERTASFTVSGNKQFYHCFGCGAHGDAINWMREYHHLPFRQALEELAGRAGITLTPINEGAKLARQSKKMLVEVEAALNHELLVLASAIGSRVSYRAIPCDVLRRYPHIQKVPNEPWEREFDAAKRIVKALYALYGAKI